jgi:hypothetical protein
VVPHVNDWYAHFGGADFEVIGVHYPEFDYERDLDNVKAALERMAIQYPVAIDNDRKTWSAYRQRYWPTRYLIDKAGNIRFKHIGEGAYDETLRLIAALIAED